MTDLATTRPHPTLMVRAASLSAKACLVVMLLLALAFPDWGHMRDKAAEVRAVTYPLMAFTVAAAWWFLWRDHRPFPWVADLMVTITCFSDILGNGMNLYDTVVWFDDWMHFMNVGLLTGAFLLLTLPAAGRVGENLERALAFGLTAALGWEIAEYFAFVSTSAELPLAYADTLGDLALGALGAVVAALVVFQARHHHPLNGAGEPESQPRPRGTPPPEAPARPRRPGLRPSPRPRTPNG